MHIVHSAHTAQTVNTVHCSSPLSSWLDNWTELQLISVSGFPPNFDEYIADRVAYDMNVAENDDHTRLF